MKVYYIQLFCSSKGTPVWPQCLDKDSVALSEMSQWEHLLRKELLVLGIAVLIGCCINELQHTASNHVSPSVNILLTVPRRYFFCGSSMLFLSCVCFVFVRVCLYVLSGNLLRKGCPLGSRLWCLTVSLSLSHWYLGSGVVLDWTIPDLCTLTYFAFLLNCTPRVGPQTLWRFRLKDVSIDERVGPDAVSVVGSTRV